MKELWELFSSFARIGGFTFGGGYAMLPMLQKEVVEKRQWATEDEMHSDGNTLPTVAAIAPGMPFCL